MGQVAALQGVRYNLGRVGRPGPVLAPPYDVVSPEAVRELVGRSPYNVLRLDLGIRDGQLDRPGDWAHARDLFRSWVETGVLAVDPVPSVYVMRHLYPSPEGGEGVLTAALVGLRAGSGPGRAALPHERTMEAVRNERLQQLRTCRTHFSPILAMAYDPSGRLQEALNGACAVPPEWEDESPLGGRVQFWAHPASEARGQAVLDALAISLDGQPAVIADGHHRFEAASRFAEESGAAPGSRYVLAALTPAEQGGLLILPIHRVVGPADRAIRERLRMGLYEQLTALSATELAPPLDEQVKGASADAVRAAAAVRDLRAALGRTVVAVYWGAGEVEFLAQPAKAAWRGGSFRPELPGAASDVLLLHRGPLAGCEARGELSPGGSGPWVAFTPSEAQAARAVDEGNAACAIFLSPVTPSDVKEAALAGKKLPEKSTYFYPKLASGLVMADMALDVLPWPAPGQGRGQQAPTGGDIEGGT